MDGSTRMVVKPTGLVRRRAALIASVTVLTVAAVLDVVWLTSDDRASLNYPLVVGVGLAGGLAVGVVVASLWDRRAGRLRSVSDIHAVTGLPVLSVVPAIRLDGADRVAATADHPIEGAQSYGFLAANLADTLRKAGRSCLLITSPTRGDGRTTTAVNLSTLLAAEGLQVALVSADPDGEGVDQMLDLERRPGLAEVLDGSSSLETALQPGGVKRLRVLTVGGSSDEVFGKNLDGLARLLERLSRSVDLVVVDAPPVLGGPEAVSLAQNVDRVLFVVDIRHGKRAEATTALAHLGHVQDRIVGCVANDPGARRSRRRTHPAPAKEPAAAPEATPSRPIGVAAAATAAGAAAGSARGAASATRGRVTSEVSPRAWRRHRWAGVIASAVALAVVISTVWWLSYDDSTEAQDGPRASDGSLAVTASSGPAAVAAAMEECRATWDAQEAPLEAAAKSLEQWQVHVSAMNQLVAGEITLPQATAFWEQTRRQAAHRVHRFESEDGAYQAGEHACPPPDDASNADPDLAALTVCADDVAQRDDVLEAARVAIGTWHHHVMDMNMVRAGTLSPTRALRLWNKSWHQGAAELHDYRSQLRQTGNQPC